MATIYLSPATYLNEVQAECHSPEQESMHSLVDLMETQLEALSLPFHRRAADMDRQAAIDASNENDCALHLALHSGLAPDSLSGALRGITLLYAQNEPESARAAAILAEGLKEIYPLPHLVRTQASGAAEQIVRTNGPAVLLELGYRDHAADASWLQHNMDEVARVICQSAAQFLADGTEKAAPSSHDAKEYAGPEEALVPVFGASTPRRGIVRAPYGGLVIRKAPEDTAPILATAENRTAVTVLETTGDWRRLQLGPVTGYARRDLVTLL